MQPGKQEAVPPVKPTARGLTITKTIRWGAGLTAGLIAILFVTSFFIDEPVRRLMERNINRSLKGYAVRLPALRVQLVGGSVTLKGLTVFQKGDERNPVAEFPVLRASIHWRALLSRRLVAEFELKRPKISVNLNQVRREAANRVPLKARGWQEAVMAIYPLKIDILTIDDGEIIYIDEDAKRPLHLSRMNLRANNIRNVRSGDQPYPSSLSLDTVIFGTGRGVVEGNCNFLAEPFPGVQGRLKLEKVPVDLIRPIAARMNLAIDKGTLDASGEIEYSPTVKRARLQDLTIQGMNLEYLHSVRTAATEKRRAALVAKAAKNLAQKSKMALRLDRIRLAGCTVGVSNAGKGKTHRIFVSDADLLLSNYTNQPSEQPTEARLSGKFMGSGNTAVTARFSPGRRGTATELHLAIEKVRLTDMNDLLLAYGGFDVTKGMFSLYSELRIRDGRISGYVKPFFKDMTVYDRQQDKGKSLTDQMYEMMVGGGAWILENRTQGEVATRADISGRIADPETSTWQIAAELMKNAFIRAMSRGFSR